MPWDELDTGLHILQKANVGLHLICYPYSLLNTIIAWEQEEREWQKCTWHTLSQPIELQLLISHNYEPSDESKRIQRHWERVAIHTNMSTVTVVELLVMAFPDSSGKRHTLVSTQNPSH